MRISALAPALCLALVLSARTHAAELWIQDPFPGGSQDVIGAQSMFDIQGAGISVTPTTTSVDLLFNFGSGQNGLAPFASFFSIRLDVGDVLFSVNGIWAYGIPIMDHAGSPNGGPAGDPVDAGHLYQIDTIAGVQSARQGLNDPGGVLYRPEQAVWLWNHNGSLTDIAVASLLVSALGGDGATSPKFEVLLNFPTPAGFYQAYTDGTLALAFSSATCGNDVLSGPVNGADDPPSNPEPASATLCALGLAFLAWRSKRRRHASRAS